ncbi:MAG TPA: phosphatidylcholine/phosphatidylserine synthase [Terriglobales bacterium]|nr:phosphatidylcholine/phosphatidylserine synthase [Terriglobales bacterium]
MRFERKPAMFRRETDIVRPRSFRKGIYILPSLATTFNIAFGYYALWHTFVGSPAEPWHYDNAAKAIGFAILFDGLDGRIARMTNTTSDFGRELDSLADVITFGVAPAMLAWVWGFRQLGPITGHDLAARTVQVGAILTFAFLIAGASRLARFNIQSNPQPSNPGRPGKRYFVGMPIPAAAGCIAAVVHFGEGDPIDTWWIGLLWAIYVFSAALLMVSTWRFYSFKDIDLRSPHPFRVVILVGLMVAGIWYFSRPLLLALSVGYLLSGVVIRMMYIFRHPKAPEYKQAPEAR